jgi:hypothetical protein
MAKQEKEPGNERSALRPVRPRGSTCAFDAGTGVAVYFRTRKMRAEGASGEEIIAEAFASFSPFFALTMQGTYSI